MARSRDQLVAVYGSDYPEAVELGGVRMSLTRQGRFLRAYYNKEAKQGAVVSRFMDGTADISFSELKDEWPRWSRKERHDFTSAAGWLNDDPEFADMMRLILEQGSQDDISAVALQVASALPSKEAFERLSAVLKRTPVGRGANINQAIAHTKHEEASNVLRKRLRATLEDSRLMDPDDFVNWVAYEAICCIECLHEGMGFSASEFGDDVRRLNRHPSDGTIDSLRHRLVNWYPWLGVTEPPEKKP